MLCFQGILVVLSFQKIDGWIFPQWELASCLSGCAWRERDIHQRLTEVYLQQSLSAPPKAREGRESGSTRPCCLPVSILVLLVNRLDQMAGIHLQSGPAGDRHSPAPNVRGRSVFFSSGPELDSPGQLPFVGSHRESY